MDLFTVLHPHEVQMQGARSFLRLDLFCCDDRLWLSCNSLLQYCSDQQIFDPR